MGNLRDAVAATGSVVRVSALRAAGVPRRAIEQAVSAQVLIRPRNGWVAVADADPLLVAAWESALRQGLVTRESRRRMPLAPLARSLLEECSLSSDSGLETFIPLRLRFLRLPIRQQVWLAG
ncbi:MAG TPA: hypothetical protein VFX99_05850, partial [Microbacterium sp.]|nr:hypothetical protein [Microbacterium sp.]